MYTEQDTDIIRDRMLANLEYDIDKREGSFVYDMYSPVAIEFTKAYMEMENVHSVLFVEDALGSDLDKKVNEFGIPRKQGAKSTGILTFKGEEDVLVPRNMTVYTDGGYSFVTISQGYIKDGSVDIEVESEVIGTQYNLPAGTIWRIPSEVIVSEIVNNQQFLGGVDIENDDDLKLRFFDAVQNIRTSGNVNDYKYWGKEIDGVYNVEVYPLWNGNGTVKVVASGENRMPLELEILSNCRYHILEQAPIGATVTVITTSLFNVSINVVVTIDSTHDAVEVKSEISTAISEYINSCIDKIYHNKLGAKILSCEGVIDYTTLTVNSSTNPIITIPSDSVPNITSVTVGV